MSYSTLELLKEIENKKVLFLDIETSGLLEEKVKHSKPEEKYEIYTNDKYYDSCRIVQIGYYYSDNFKFEKPIKANNITSILRKPNGFNISKDATSVHKITTEDAIKNGIKIKEILDGDFGKSLKKCEYIVGYNIFFVMAVVLNELHRKEMTKTIDHLKTIFESNKILCLGIISGNVCKPKGWTRFNQYQIPKMRDVYFECFEKYYGGEHDAKFDILACIEISQYIIANKNSDSNSQTKKMFGKEIKGTDGIQNFGKKWKSDELLLLMEEIESNIKISEIAKSHGRTDGSVKSKLMDLAIKEIQDGKDRDYICKKYHYSEELYDICLHKKNNDDIKKEDKKEDKNKNTLTIISTSSPQNVPNISGNVLVQILAKLAQIDKKLNILMGESDNKSKSYDGSDSEHESKKSESESEIESEESESEDEKPKKKIKGIFTKK